MRHLFHIRPLTPNIGNDLIALGLHTAMRLVLGHDFSLISLPAKGGGAIKAAGLSARVVYEANQFSDGVVIGPGNLFENGGLEVDPTAVAALRKPLLIFGVSHGRILDRNGHFVDRTDSLSPERIRAAITRANVVLVRDQATFTLLRRMGFSHHRLGGCPSLWLDQENLPHCEDSEAETAGAALISIRHPQLMSVPCELQGRTYFDVRRLIDRLRRTHPVYLLCHDYQDLSFARAFEDVPALYTEDVGRFLGWLRGCAVNVGYRLHGFLTCCALNTPAVHLSYDERGRSLIETAGLGAWDIDLLADEWFQQLEDRLANLPRLEMLKSAARPLCAELKRIQIDAIADWASIRVGESLRAA